MTVPIALSPAAEPGKGGGHVVRCLALARALQQRGAETVFVVSPLGADLLKRMGWAGAVSLFRDQTERQAALTGAGAAVLDDYSLDAAFESQLTMPVVVIDDLADRPHLCRLLIDSAYRRTASDYEDLARGARLMLGPTYALLRDGFASSGRAVRPHVERVLVGFGLSDVGGVTGRSLNVLLSRAPQARFDVAIASDLPSRDQLAAFAAAHARVTLHLDADMAPLMHAADIGVGAGGGMVWERRAAALPQLVVAVADNQRPMAARLAAAGVIAAVDLLDPAFEVRLGDVFSELTSPDARQAQLDASEAACDGHGAGRVASAILGLLA